MSCTIWNFSSVDGDYWVIRKAGQLFSHTFSTSTQAVAVTNLLNTLDFVCRDCEMWKDVAMKYREALLPENEPCGEEWVAMEEAQEAFNKAVESPKI